jgi:hypothetical protein
MTRAYALPLLLLEFDAERPFALSPEAALPPEVARRDVRSLLCLLLLLILPGCLDIQSTL